MNLPKRKPTRLKEYDYATPGTYFITICTKDRRCLLSNIVGQGLAPAENRLSIYGSIARQEIEALGQRYQSIQVDKYVIMPNHIHLLITNCKTAGASPCPTMSDVICTFKSITTRKCKMSGLRERQMFQQSFYDHVIRGEIDYKEIWEYIDNNVCRWAQDDLYSAE